MLMAPRNRGRVGFSGCEFTCCPIWSNKRRERRHIRRRERQTVNRMLVALDY